MRVKNFLKPDRHQHKDPQVRLDQIRALDPTDQESQETLIELALDDDDLTVRTTAIGRVADVNVLRRLLDANGDNAAEIRSAAEQRVASCLEAGEINDADVGRLLESHAERLAVSVAVHSSQAQQRQQAMSLIPEESSFLHVVQQSRFHDTRLAAAERLSQHDVLRAALSACRSRDKVVAKRLQQRLDAQAAAEAELIAARHAVSTTLASMQALASSVWSPQHSGRQLALQVRWDALDDELKGDSQAAFQAAADGVSALQAEHEASTPASGSDAASSADQPAASSVTPTDAVATAESNADTTSGTQASIVNSDPQLIAVIDGLRDVLIKSIPDALTPWSATPLNDAAGPLVAHAQAVAVMFDPPLDVAKARPGVLQQRIDRVKTLLDTETTLPTINVSEVTYIAELTAHLDEMVQRLDKAKQESTDRIKATHRQFAALSSTVSDGKWGPANSMLRRLQKKVAAMEPAERTTLTDKLSRAEKQLADMADWQDFAARPKLEALCEAMEVLPAAEQKPEALAREVKNLQAQWKALGISRASNDLWSRFKTAGDTAKQSELEASDADWKALQRLTNDAKREWSRNRIPDRKPDKALEARFSAALKPFETHMGEQYDANAALKQELVEKIQKLAEGEINQHSVNQARSLQSAWKQVGIMRRKEDQTLWEAFNGHCRTIFKQHKAGEREQLKASMGHVFRARDIIKTLRQIAKQGSPDDAQVQALATEFQGLEAFPDKDKKFLLRDFRGAMDACSRVQQTQSKRREQAEHDELLRRVGLCEQLEAAVESPDMRTDTLRDDVTHAWEASDVKLNRELDQRLLARRDAATAHLDANTRFDYDEAESLRRDLLIKMEVTASVDTPAEDKARRMQYQLAHLQEGMTSAGVADKRAALAALELDWLSAPPVLRAVHDSLQSRYLKAVGR